MLMLMLFVSLVVVFLLCFFPAFARPQVADDDRTLLPALECLASIVVAVGGALDVSREEPRRVHESGEWAFFAHPPLSPCRTRRL